jgi:hypothetical protein
MATEWTEVVENDLYTFVGNGLEVDADGENDDLDPRDMNNYLFRVVAGNDCGSDMSCIATLNVVGCQPIVVAGITPAGTYTEVAEEEEDQVTFTVNLTEGTTETVTYMWYIETVDTWNRPLTDNDYNTAVLITPETSIDGVEFAGCSTSELRVTITGGNDGWNLAKSRFWAEVVNECTDTESVETPYISDKVTLDVFDAEQMQQLTCSQ